MSDGSNVPAACATASAAVGRSSVASSSVEFVDGPDWSVAGSVSVASRVLGPPGPAVVPAVERASVVYYGRHVSLHGRILHNCLCWCEDRRGEGSHGGPARHRQSVRSPEGGFGPTRPTTR
ncbi:hypothetical protein BN903_2 [Halorubrum sp. AJ67]|nr:hypothetical protein BN903_2 [Halorubrum sp. AJ67]